MANVIKKDKSFQESLSELSVEQLLELEEIIMNIMKKKLQNRKHTDWRKDFKKISVWTHLRKSKVVKVDKWEIEKF